MPDPLPLLERLIAIDSVNPDLSPGGPTPARTSPASFWARQNVPSATRR